MTFEEKLEKFKSERVGFLVKSREIADELAKVLIKEGMKGRGNWPVYLTLKGCLTDNKEYPGTPYVTYNYFLGEHKLSYGTDDCLDEPMEIIDVTLEELNKYNTKMEE